MDRRTFLGVFFAIPLIGRLCTVGKVKPALLKAEPIINVVCTPNAVLDNKTFMAIDNMYSGISRERLRLWVGGSITTLNGEKEGA